MNILKGYAVAADEMGILVKSEKGIFYIHKDKLGGARKEKRMNIFLGKPIEFVEDGVSEDGKLLGSREKALTKRKGELNAEVGAELKATVMAVFEKSMLVVCAGHEVYIPVEDCVIFRTENLQASGEFTEGQEVTVFVKEVEPLKLVVEKRQELDLISKGNEYVGVVKSMAPKTVFVQLEISKTVVFCRPVEWARAIAPNQTVVVEINDIKSRADKDLVYGIVRKRIKG